MLATPTESVIELACKILLTVICCLSYGSYFISSSSGNFIRGALSPSISLLIIRPSASTLAPSTKNLTIPWFIAPPVIIGSK